MFAKSWLRGFEVEVITGFPNYPEELYTKVTDKIDPKEKIDGVLIARVLVSKSYKSKFGRIANYLSFVFSSLIYGLIFAKRPHLIYAYHLLNSRCFCINNKIFRRVPIVLDIQDMWPDTLRATGMISNSRILGFINKICNLVYSSVTKIVVLSPGFKDLLIRGASHITRLG